MEIRKRHQHMLDKGDDRDGDAAGSPRVIDSATVRAHRHSAGSRNGGGPPQPGRGWSRSGANPGAVVDGNGQQKAPRLSPGRAADSAETEALPKNMQASVTVTADRACDTDAISGHLTTATILPEVNRKSPQTRDRAASATRNPVERCFWGIKEFRRVAARYDTRARNLLSAVMLAAPRRPCIPGIARVAI